jgi:hypothetical protein
MEVQYIIDLSLICTNMYNSKQLATDTASGEELMKYMMRDEVTSGKPKSNPVGHGQVNIERYKECLTLVLLYIARNQTV